MTAVSRTSTIPMTSNEEPSASQGAQAATLGASNQSLVTTTVTSTPRPATVPISTNPVPDKESTPTATAAARASVSDSGSTATDEEETWSFWDLLKWCPASKKILRESENNILSCLKTPYTRGFVNVGPVVGTEDCKIWTLRLGEDKNSSEIPVVFIHGFASGLALWVLNYDAVAATRPVYGIDLLGFGQSSRPKFSSDPKEAENQFVNSIEAWRYILNIPKFILVGHSLGGFLVTSYAIRYPDPVQHIVLADPWGFVDEPAIPKLSAHMPYYLMCFLKVCENAPLNFNRLWLLRLPGRMGPKCLQLFRSDLMEHFVPVVPDAKTNIANYIFQCNVQTPSGESAFKAMTKSLAWAQNPLHSRLHAINPELPMTFVYGGKSWVDHLPFEEIVQKRGSPLVYIHELEAAGHNVYAGRHTNTFNEILINAFQTTKGNVNQSYCSVPDLDIDRESPGVNLETSKDDKLKSPNSK